MALSVLCSLLAAFVAVGGASDVAEALPSLPSSRSSFSPENATEESLEKANGRGPTWAQCKSSCRSYCLRYDRSEWLMSYKSPGRAHCHCGTSASIKSTGCIKDYECGNFENCDMDLEKCVLLYNGFSPREYKGCNQYKSGALNVSSPENAEELPLDKAANAAEELPLSKAANATEELPLDKAANGRGPTWAQCKSSCRSKCRQNGSWQWLMQYESPGRGYCYCYKRRFIKSKSCIKSFDCSGKYYCDMDLGKCVDLIRFFKGGWFSGCGQLKSGVPEVENATNILFP